MKTTYRKSWPETLFQLLTFTFDPFFNVKWVILLPLTLGGPGVDPTLVLAGLKASLKFLVLFGHVLSFSLVKLEILSHKINLLDILLHESKIPLGISSALHIYTYLFTR